MMSFGFTPPEISHFGEIPSTLDDSVIPDVPPDPHSTTDPDLPDNFESLPITEDTPYDKSNYQPALSDLNQTPIVVHSTPLTSSDVAPSLFSRFHWLILVVSFGLGITLILKVIKKDTGDTLPQRAADPEVKTNPLREAAQAPNSSAQPAPLRALEHLSLLPIPSATWPQLHLEPHRDPQQGLMWVYRGGRIEDRLGRLVYDLHFTWREGDPPIQAWIESEALRWTLLERTPRTSIKQRAGELLISQALRDDLIAQRTLLRKRHFKIAEVLSTTQGLIVLTASERCTKLTAGDLIKSMRWVVKGKRRLSGSCQNIHCLNAHQKALKAKPSMMKFSLTLNLSRVQRGDNGWSRHDQSIKCTL